MERDALSDHRPSRHHSHAQSGASRSASQAYSTAQSARDEADDKLGDPNQQLPPLAESQNVPKRTAQLKEGKTTPPKPYDDASLLTAVKNAGQGIKNEDLAAYMTQSGLGTPATRAAIIEKLISVSYIERKKKSLLPTEKRQSPHQPGPSDSQRCRSNRLLGTAVGEHSERNHAG